MFPINNYKDLYMAYYLLKLNLDRVPRREDHIKEIKDAIRRFQNKPPRNRQVIYEDDAPSCIVKIKAPAWCRTKDDVIGWFEREEYLECQPSMYDCTGQYFTNWYKPGILHGTWYVYHSVGMDV